MVLGMKQFFLFQDAQIPGSWRVKHDVQELFILAAIPW